jgi:phage FluMu gp28-like protein
MAKSRKSSANGAAVTPLALLLPYQRAWADDPARWKIWLAARQIGKSFAAAAEVARDCYQRPGATWVVLSAGERQALEFMQKVRQWTEAFGLALRDYAEQRSSVEALLKSAEVRYGNGSRVVALPANPDTARGYSANLVLDEFAFHQDSLAIWRAILPSVTNPLRGQLKVRVLSTPNGQGNGFYNLWSDDAAAGAPAGAQWSRHRTTIHDAVAAGLPVNIAELKRQLNDPDGWAQEFECQFIDMASVLLPYELIEKCESPEASDWGWRAGNGHGPCYMGVDIGRKHDLTVAWVLERIGDVLWTREVRVLEKMPFHLQFTELAALAHGLAARTCVDATGIGQMLAEELARQIGAARVEPCTFTAQFKQELYPPLRRKMEDRLLRLPVSRAIREDLHGLQRVSGAAGTVRYLAPHTDDGHCDRATALALAVRAAESAAPPGEFRLFAGDRRTLAIVRRRARVLAG